MGDNYNRLYFSLDKSNTLAFCEPEKADYIAVPTSEYNGYEKAIRVIRDRALQQIDKSQADEHGYTLLRADRKYHKDYNIKGLWLITKSTPYSIKIPLGNVTPLIERDLKDFYGLFDLYPLKYQDIYRNEQHEMKYGDRVEWLSPSDLFEHWDDIMASNVIDTYDYNISKGYPGRWYKACREWIDNVDRKITFDMCKISCNFAKGVYEVSYWGLKSI